MKQHIVHTFVLPAGARQLDIKFHYKPARVGRIRNLLCLTIFDPDGFRGTGHRGGVRQVVHLGATQATPGYRPGPLPAGEWTVELDTHMVLSGEPCHYRIDVTASDAMEANPVPSALAPFDSAPLRREAGWYRGDLHAHTVHSDGGWRIAALLQAAQAIHLDFLTLTDHNTVSGLDEFVRTAPPGLLTMVGSELTTYWGHALSLGTRHWIDWRTRPGGRTMAQIAQDVTDANGLFVIAHPGSEGDPVCTGCAWRYTDMMPGSARRVEVWNGAWSNHDSGNERSLAAFYSWLNQGYRLGATAGSDAHGPHGYKTGPGFNVVYAEELSQSAILRAIARGHLYLSTGPRLEMSGRTAAGDQAMMGDILPGTEGEISAQWDGAPRGARLRLIADGNVVEEARVGENGARSWPLAKMPAQWRLAELRDSRGRMVALTNPIFTEEGRGL
jgi:hypothetical protein